jgi:hypothetical protein
MIRHLGVGRGRSFWVPRHLRGWFLVAVNLDVSDFLVFTICSKTGPVRR